MLSKFSQTHVFLQNFVLLQPRTSPPKICKIWLIFLISLTRTAQVATSWRDADASTSAPLSWSQPPAAGLGLVDRIVAIGQTLEGSISAVSKPNFASKYAFESSRRDLHKALLCTTLKSHFSKNWQIARIFKNLRFFSEIC